MVRWLPPGEDGAEVVVLRQERREEAAIEREAEAMSVAGRLATCPTAG